MQESTEFYIYTNNLSEVMIDYIKIVNWSCM